MSRLVVRPQANRDVIEIALRIGEDSPSAGERFFDAIEYTTSLLLTMPTMDSASPVANPKLEGLRLVTIPGFRNHVILYRVQGEQVEVVRVIHGSRDLENVIDETS